MATPSETVDRERRSGIDGGRAWAIAAAGCLVNAWTFGVFYSFGAAFEQVVDEFDAGLGATAAVFAITTFLFFALGAVAGPLSDRFGPRPLLVTGAASIGIGLIATSQVTSLLAGYVTYGVGVGVGIACYLVPMTAAVGGWFERRRSLAIGLYTGGIGLGTLLLVPVAEWLIRTEGWRDSFLLFGISTGAVYLFAAAVVTKPPSGEPNPAPTVGPSRRPIASIVSQFGFGRMYAASFFMTAALFVPFVFIVKYATDRGVSSQTAAILISVIGVGSVIGRFGLGLIGTRLDVFMLAFGSYAIQPLGYLLWLLSGGHLAALIVFASVLGLAYGGYVALGPVLAAELYGVDDLGAVLGILYTSAGFGGLIGPIGAGILLDETQSFAIVIGLSVGLTTLATIVFWPLRRRPLTAASSTMATVGTVTR